MDEDIKKVLKRLGKGIASAPFAIVPGVKESISDSNAVKEDKLKSDLKAGILAGAGIKGSLKDLPKGKKEGGKVFKSGQSYRGYGKARIPS